MYYMSCLYVAHYAWGDMERQLSNGNQLLAVNSAHYLSSHVSGSEQEATTMFAQAPAVNRP